MGEPSSKLSLKLVIDKKANKVLFAEAGKEAVDFIFSILALPVGTVTRLLSEQGMVGCLSDIYKSFENLNEDYVQPNLHKDIILKPTVYNTAEEASLFMLTNKKPETPKLYRCLYTGTNSIIHVTNKLGTKCPYCQRCMDIDAPIVEGSKGGFVKGAFTYMVMDDLAVSPTSAVAVVSFLNKLNVDVKSVEEKVIDLDMDKGLKKSFQSKKVLTEVFLQGQGNESGVCAVSMYRPF